MRPLIIHNAIKHVDCSSCMRSTHIWLSVSGVNYSVKKFGLHLPAGRKAIYSDPRRIRSFGHAAIANQNRSKLTGTPCVADT